MKPSKAEREPSHWYKSSDTWIARKEQLSNKIWMTCYRRPEDCLAGYKPAMWVYVHKRRAGADSMGNLDIIERLRFEDDDPLMLECVAHEMRRKYGGS